jgi:hypothetical protein
LCGKYGEIKTGNTAVLKHCGFIIEWNTKLHFWADLSF